MSSALICWSLNPSMESPAAVIGVRQGMIVFCQILVSSRSGCPCRSTGVRLGEMWPATYAWNRYAPDVAWWAVWKVISMSLSVVVAAEVCLVTSV